MDIGPYLHTFFQYLNILIRGIQGLYDRFGYLIVYCAELAGNTVFASVVIPSGTFAIFGGYYARQGSLNIFGVIFFVWLGIMSGFSADYVLGRFILSGPFHAIERTWVGRSLKFSQRLDQAQTLLNRHGGKAILISHGWGHFRSFIALSAGITKMRFKIFIMYEIIASFLWSIMYCSIGYFIGIEQTELTTHVELFGVAIFVTIGFFMILISSISHVLAKRYLTQLPAQETDDQRFSEHYVVPNGRNTLSETE